MSSKRSLAFADQKSNELGSEEAKPLSEKRVCVMKYYTYWLGISGTCVSLLVEAEFCVKVG